MLFDGNKKRFITNKVYRPVEDEISEIRISEIGKLKKDNSGGLNVYIDYRPSIKKHSDTLIEAVGTVLKRHEKNGLTIPMSGGADSEAVAYACVKFDIDFTPTIMRYIYDGEIQNTDDFHHAEIFCAKHEKTPRYIDLDCNYFFDDELYLKYVTEYYTTSPQLACHVWGLSHMKGFVVFPGDIPVVASDKLCMPPTQYYCYDYYLHKHELSGITHLFTHNEDILINGMRLYQKVEHLKDKYTKKRMFYQLGGFDISTDIVEKKTGFEGIRNAISEKYQERLRIFNQFYRFSNSRYIPLSHVEPPSVYVDKKYKDYMNE
jgi:hypothetical protein